MPLSTDHTEDGDDSNMMAAKQSIWQSLWQNNQGASLILLAEMVGTSMDAIVRYLQQGDARIHPLQLMFARTIVISILSSLYMWWTQVPDFPFGKPEVRGWLVLRAICGSSGLLCFYYAVHYLPLAETTIFRFLVPIPTAFLCFLLLGTPFTSKELIAGIIALIGVVIVAHPAYIFGDSIHATHAGEVDPVSPKQRLVALIIMSLSIFGTVGAYTTIRIIGDRAHALISVNYFSVLACIASTVGLLAIPGIGFTMPKGPREWVFLALLGLLGFTLQFLLTKGLQLDKSSKATSMIYMQIVFALVCDWVIWRVVPGLWSWVGGGIVIASTLWVALQKGNAEKVDGKKTEGLVVDEESALLGAETEEGDDVGK